MKWINTAVDDNTHQIYKQLEGVTWPRVIEAGVRILQAVGPDNFEDLIKSVTVPEHLIEENNE